MQENTLIHEAERINIYANKKAISIPFGHWSTAPMDGRRADAITTLKIEGHNYFVQLNPTDSRCYRAIVAIIDNNRQYICNRELTESELLGLYIAASMVCNAYSKIVPFVQSAKAGNNAFLPKTIEPIFHHIHVWGRGEPGIDYVTGVPLGGPQLGVIFDMRGRSGEPGNNRKVPWEPENMKAVIQTVQKFI